jgi:mitogen-activated protein kinase 1/3
MVESIPMSDQKALTDLYPSADPEALDLLEKLLDFNPDKRPTAEEGSFSCFLLRSRFASDVICS